MEELKEFLLTQPHIKFVYFVGEDWYINKPSFEYKVKTREELLGSEKVEEKAEVKSTKKTK